jgi:hypothetical protein
MEGTRDTPLPAHTWPGATYGSKKPVVVAAAAAINTTNQRTLLLIAPELNEAGDESGKKQSDTCNHG